MEKKFKKYYRIINYSSINKSLELSNYGYTKEIYTSIFFKQVNYISCITTLNNGFTLKEVHLEDYLDILKKSNITIISANKLFIIENENNIFYIIAESYSVKRLKYLPNITIPAASNNNGDVRGIKYKIIESEKSNTEKINKDIIIGEPLSILNLLLKLYSVDYLIEWLENLIQRNIPDYSENTKILNTNFLLLGSNKSKIPNNAMGVFSNTEIEFYTSDLLQLYRNWKTFLDKSSNLK